MVNSHSLDLEATSSQYAQITDAAQTGLDITGDITIEFWTKLETLANCFPVNKATSSGNQVSYRFRILADGSFRIQWHDDGTGGSRNDNVSSAGGHVSAGTWAHLAIALDVSAKTSYMYVNGSPVASELAIDGGSTSIFNGSAPFQIGTGDGGTPADFVDGLIDEVRVWNDIRTAAEIQANYNKQLNGNEAGLVGYWRLNNDYLDETSNNNDLTAANSPTFSIDVPFSDTQEGYAFFM